MATTPRRLPLAPTESSERHGPYRWTASCNLCGARATNTSLTFAIVQLRKHTCDQVGALIDDPNLTPPTPRRCTTCNRDLAPLDTHTKCPACRSAEARKTQKARR